MTEQEYSNKKAVRDFAGMIGLIIGLAVLVYATHHPLNGIFMAAANHLMLVGVGLAVVCLIILAVVWLTKRSKTAEPTEMAHE